jgi:hypothetical protein
MAINAEDTKNTLFGGITKPKTAEVKKLKTQEVPESKTAKHTEPDISNNSKSSKLPKWKTLEKVTVLMTNTQKDAIDDLARKLMRLRSHEVNPKEERERITANTIFRALLDNFLSRIDLLDMKKVYDEDELKEWLGQLFK